MPAFPSSGGCQIGSWPTSLLVQEGGRQTRSWHLTACFFKFRRLSNRILTNKSPGPGGRQVRSWLLTTNVYKFRRLSNRILTNKSPGPGGMSYGIVSRSQLPNSHVRVELSNFKISKLFFLINIKTHFGQERLCTNTFLTCDTLLYSNLVFAALKPKTNN